jgi:dihydrofolate reductase
MGRKTFSSLSEKSLEGRLNIVITSKLKQSSNIIYLQKKESIITLKNYTDRLIFIIGGSQIFSLFKNDIEEWLITKIPIEMLKADVYMPNGYLDDFSKLNEYKISKNLICEHFIKKSRTPNVNLIDHIRKYIKNA